MRVAAVGTSGLRFITMSKGFTQMVPVDRDHRVSCAQLKVEVSLGML